jgi:hypothetical protein
LASVVLQLHDPLVQFIGCGLFFGGQDAPPRFLQLRLQNIRKLRQVRAVGFSLPIPEIEPLLPPTTTRNVITSDLLIMNVDELVITL